MMKRGEEEPANPPPITTKAERESRGTLSKTQKVSHSMGFGRSRSTKIISLHEK
jgi:hypothetical protein